MSYSNPYAQPYNSRYYPYPQRLGSYSPNAIHTGYGYTTPFNTGYPAPPNAIHTGYGYTTPAQTKPQEVHIYHHYEPKPDSLQYSLEPQRRVTVQPIQQPQYTTEGPSHVHYARPIETVAQPSYSRPIETVSSQYATEPSQVEPVRRISVDNRPTIWK